LKLPNFVELRIESFSTWAFSGTFSLRLWVRSNGLGSLFNLIKLLENFTLSCNTLLDLLRAFRCFALS
jgi:hypothetical protein